MKYEIIFFLISFSIAYSLIPVVKLIAKNLKLYDIPSDRKLHVQPIPALGGVAIFISFMISIVCSKMNLNIAGAVYLFAGTLILFATGLIDDVKTMSAKKRLIVQFICAGLCVAAGYSFQLDYGILGIGNFSAAFQIITSLFFIVLVINAFNLIDGVNGLAGGLGLVVSLVFAYLFSVAGNQTWSTVALILSGSLLGFLNFNFGKASIFLGDNGSTILGLFAAIFFLRYINLPAQQFTSTQSVVQGLSLLSIPILDLLRVSIGRIQKGLSPFYADQTHIHHVLLKRYDSHKTVCIVILIFQISLYLLGSSLENTFSPITIIGVIILTFGLFVKVINISQDLSEIKSMEQERRQLGILH